jgi:broad specificity phosphatase PhoE
VYPTQVLVMLPAFVHSFPPGTTPKHLHFVRHAHGKHNEVGEVDYEQYQREDLIDAELTDKGIEQCQELNKINEKYLKSQLVVVSPMRRTLQTATKSFPDLIEKVPWIALECLREQTGLHPCDKRFPISFYQENYPYVDYSFIESDEDPLYPLYEDRREPHEDMDQRAKQFLNWIQTRPETEIVVVSHSAFLRGLFQRVLFPSDPFTRFENCETRSFAMYFPNSEEENLSSASSS